MPSKALRRLLDTAESIGQNRGWLREHTALWWARHHLRKAVYVSGALQWGTKSFEFWTLLMAILAVVRPKSMVEFGSGRSTSYLAEYAMKQGVPYASIEQNRGYARRIKLGLSNSFLDPRYLHHIPIAPDGWYDPEVLGRVAPPDCELLFVDGPVGAQEEIGKGVRRCERADNWLAAAAAAASSKVLIVDDVHRRSNLVLFRALTSSAPHLRPFFVSYNVQAAPNIVAIGVLSSSYPRIVRICSEAGIEIHTEYADDQCSEP